MQYIAIIRLFGWATVGWVTLPFFSFLFLLVCYAHVFPCNYNHDVICFHKSRSCVNHYAVLCNYNHDVIIMFLFISCAALVERATWLHTNLCM